MNTGTTKCIEPLIFSDSIYCFDNYKMSLDYLDVNSLNSIKVNDIIFFKGYYLKVEDVIFKEYAKHHYWFKKSDITDKKVYTLKCEFIK